MGVVSTLAGYLIGGNSGFFIIFVVPVVLLVGILWLCKTYNFSMMPDGLQGAKPHTFKFPKLSRSKTERMYKWNVEDEDESDDESSEYEEEEGSPKVFTEGNMYD